MGTNIRNFVILGKFLDGKLEKEEQIFPKKLDFEKNECSPKLFTPTSNFFYTDLSAISVTFRNSG